jgi:hypothetical protein
MTDWLYEASNAQAQLENCTSRLNRISAIITDIETMIADPSKLTDSQGRMVAAVSKSKLLEMLAEAKGIANG